MYRLAACLMGLAACAAAADLTPELRTERQRIAAERQRLEAAFAEEEARCASRFAVTACLDDVRQRRRAALELPRSRELAIDDIERRQRATARREAVEEKQRRAAARPVAEPASSAAPARALPAPAPASSAREPHAPPSADLARQRAAAAHERQEKLRATQQRVQAREAERARQGRRAAPLPVPASGAPPRQP